MTKNNEIFKALADDTRLRLLNLFLVTRVPLCVCEIADALHLPQYNVSKHLNLLRHVGLVDVEKKGLWGYYYLKNNEQKNSQIFDFLKDYLAGEEFQSDNRNLKTRLNLREDGKCVVGNALDKKCGKPTKRKKE